MSRTRLHRRIIQSIVSTGVCLCSAVSQATPQGGTLVAGEGSVNAAPGMTTVNQFSQQMVMDWNSFNIAAGEAVRFNQPSTAATALNRIFDQNATQIFGSLQANGNVFLFNNKGFLFGESANVNVGGLVATSLAIDPADFMAGIYHLASDAQDGGLIINRGLLQAATGGISLISDTGVVNEGKIYAQRGMVNLATAAVATLDFDGDGLLRLEVSDAVADNLESLDSAVNNSGEIHANGGEVLLAGSVARDVFSNVVNNSGRITANSIINEGGVVRLVSRGGDTLNSGHIQANSAFNRGGVVQVLGDRVALIGDASVEASGMLGGGEVLVGGDFQGNNPDVQNASHTYVGAQTRISSDAQLIGEGGKVIIWADEVTRFHGQVSAEAGQLTGDGGFVEVSGKQHLDFKGDVSTYASNGNVGTLLLDPLDINIVDGAAGSAADDTELDEATADRSILFCQPVAAACNDDADTTVFTISEGTLESMTSNVILQARQDIIIGDLTTDGVLFFDEITAGEYVSFQAGNNIIFTDPTDTLQTAGGDIHLEADSSHGPTLTGDVAGDPANGTGGLNLGILNSAGGDITLIGDENELVFNAAINAGSGNISISTAQDGQTLELGSANDLSDTELNRLLSSGVLTIGEATSAGADGTRTAGQSEYIANIDVTGDVTFSSTVADQINLYAAGDGTDDFSIDTNATLTMAQNLMIDLDRNTSTGEFKIDGEISAGANDVTIKADNIDGDNTGGTNGIEIATTGTVTLEASSIGIKNDPFNIDGATALNIIDTASGDMFINLVNSQANDLSFEAGDIDLAQLNALNSFDFTSHSGFAIGSVSAAQIDLSFEAQTGNITNTGGNLTVGNLTLIVAGADAAIGTSGDPFGNIEIDNGASAGSLNAMAANGSGGIYIEADGDFDLGNIDTGTGDLAIIFVTSGDVTDSGTITVGGNSSFSLAEGRSVTLDGVSNSYAGSVAFIAGGSGTFDSITFADTTAIELQNITTTNDLIVTSAAGITQALASGIVVGGNADFTADGAITLIQTGNDFNTLDIDNGTTAATTVDIVDQNAIELGTLVIEGDLDITAGGAIVAANVTNTDTDGSDGINVSGNTVIRAGQNSSILLDDNNNVFSGSVTLSQQGLGIGDKLNNVSITSASDLALQAIDMSGALFVIADSLSTTGGLTVAGAADLRTNTGDINLGAAITADSLILNSAAAITENASAVITVTNHTDIDASGSISLSNAANDFTSIDLDNNGNTAAIIVTDTDSIELGRVEAGGDLTVTAGGSITDTGDAANNAGAGQFVTGNATFNTGVNAAFILDNTANLYAGTLAFNQPGSYNGFSFTNTSTNNLSLPSMVVNGNLSIVTGGDLSQGGAITVNLVTDISSDGQIVLTDSGNDFVGDLVLDNSSNSAAVSVTDSNSIVLGDINLGGDLTVTAGTALSAGNISDTAVQSVAGNAVFNAGQFGSIVLDSTNDYQGTVDFNSQASPLNIIGVTFNNSGDIDMLAVSTTSLALESTTGGISSSQQISVTGSTTLNAAGAISLNNATNNLQGTIEIIDATDATLVNNNAIQFAGTANVSGTLDLTAAGNLSAGAVTITADTLLIDAVTLGALNTDVNTLGISLSSASAIAVNNNGGFAVDASGITAFNGAITLAAAGGGDITISGDVQNQNGTGSINLQANSGSIINAGGVLTTAGNVDLDALNGIGADGSPVQVSNAAGLLLTTTASNADIFVQHDDDLSLFSFSVSTNGASAQTVSLTAASWNFNNFVSLNFDDFVFTATTGGITDSGGVLFDANSLKLDSATGIGSNVNPIVTVDVNSVDLASNGSFASGDIFLQDFTGSPLTIDSISTDNTLNSAQQVSVIATGISLGGDIATTNDNIILDAGAGAFDGGGNTLAGASVGLIAQGNIDNITTDARSLAARSSSGVIDIASVHSGSDLIIDDLGVVVGLSTTNNDITLSSQDASIDIATAINAGITGSVSLTTTESAVVADHDIGGLALVTAGGGLSLNADGGVSGVLVDLDSSSLDLTSAGIGSAGDISIVISDGMTTSRINTLDTDNGSSQDVTLTAASWSVNSNLDADNDNLALIASSGNIVRTSGSLSANDLSLIANSAGASIGGLGSPTELIEIALMGDLTASAGTGAGGIFINSPGSAIVVSNTGLNAGSGDIHLTSSSSITGNGQLAASNLLLVSAGDIDVNTTIDLVALSAGSGDITLNNTGNLIIGSQTHADTTVYNGITTSGDLNLTATGVIDDSISGSIIASDVSVTSTGGLNLDSAQHATTSFGASDLAGGNLQLNHQGVLVLTGLTTTGNASITNDSSVNSSSGVIDVSSFSLQSVGGASLDNAANAIDSVSVTDTGAGDITVVDNGDLTLDLISTTGIGNISIITDGNVSQQQNVGSGTGNISVESTNGNIIMQEGTVTRTDGGSINYRTSGGDIAVALLDAGLAAGSININAQLGVGRVFKAGTDITAPNVSANTVEITSGAIGQGFDFGLDDSITGIITLNYTTTAFVTSAPLGADLNIVDNGPGVFNSSGARSAGNQRGQSGGLEDVGFIDTALFSDINLFVVDGTGIGLPEDQSDISPEDRRRFRDIEDETTEDE